jgi:hypothetical protein
MNRNRARTRTRIKRGDEKEEEEDWSAGLFHDFGNHEEAIRLSRRITEGLFVRKTGLHLVRASHIYERERVCCRLNSADVDFLQLFDVAEDVSELRAELLLLLGGQGDSRQMGNIFDINFNGIHTSILDFCLFQFWKPRSLEFVAAGDFIPRQTCA